MTRLARSLASPPQRRGFRPRLGVVWVVALVVPAGRGWSPARCRRSPSATALASHPTLHHHRSPLLLLLLLLLPPMAATH